jgi:magnesium-transporting ATPase (P-type)
VESTEDNYLETNNIGMQGTHCISGSCLGVCVATGDSTVFGRIAKLTSDPKTGMTPLQKEIFRFVLIISTFITVVVVVIVVLWYAGWSLRILVLLTMLQGGMVAQGLPRLDQRASSDCQLCVGCSCFHP